MLCPGKILTEIRNDLKKFIHRTVQCQELKFGWIKKRELITFTEKTVIPAD